MDKNKDHKDQLVDELLKDHAKHGTEHDEQFLQELDQRIAEGVQAPRAKKTWGSPGGRWALGTGLAACAAIGAWSLIVTDEVIVMSSPPELLSFSPPSAARSTVRSSCLAS